ncbi:MAG: N-6 DNA methylase [Oscillospiraceae bacterium]|nr:N-6 DNA methylase [Oscillospiraceae bacterium]
MWNNHLLEAIVALPDQISCNTGVYTYIWILSKKTGLLRAHKVQTIDVTVLFLF